MSWLLHGDYPDEQELDNSPAITNWTLSTRRAPCLAGFILEHPLLGSMVPNGLTSEVWLIDLDRKYARTFSRFYRLGEKAAEA